MRQAHEKRRDDTYGVITPLDLGILPGLNNFNKNFLTTTLIFGLVYNILYVTEAMGHVHTLRRRHMVPSSKGRYASTPCAYAGSTPETNNKGVAIMKTQKRPRISPSLVVKIFWIVAVLFLVLGVSFLLRHAYLDAIATFFVAAFCFYVIKRINAVRAADQ